MWKQLAELFTGVFTLTHRLDKLEQAVKEQQREMKELTALVNRLAFELGRTNEAQRHGQEREAGEREKFMLRIENQLLKAGRQLPPASPPGAEP